MLARLALSLVFVACASAAWMPNGNYYDMRIQNCGGNPSLHGLWPQWGESCSAPAFDVSKIASIKSQMLQYWSSCAGSMTNEQFWAHEWSKHGSCTGMDQLTYFTTALNLFQQYAMATAPPTQMDFCFTKSSLNIETCPTSSSNDGDADSSSDADASSYNAVATSSQQGADLSAPIHHTVIVAVVGVLCFAAVVAGAIAMVIWRRRVAARTHDLPLFAAENTPL